MSSDSPGGAITQVPTPSVRQFPTPVSLVHTHGVRAWFPEPPDPRARFSAFGQIARHHTCIEKRLGTCTPATIRQRLRDEHGLTSAVR